MFNCHNFIYLTSGGLDWYMTLRRHSSLLKMFNCAALGRITKKDIPT
jgi:hypothetical protein